MANRFGDPEERLTPQELAAASGIVSWKCPRCGNTDWRGEENTEVNDTRHPVRQQVTKRMRICRKCKQVAVETQEAVVPKGHRLVVIPDSDIEAMVA